MVTKTGTGGSDTLTGGSGADILKGLGGNDLLKGLGDADRIDGGTGNDTLEGGAGNDTLFGGGGDDSIDGGDGLDTLSFSGVSTGVTFNLGYTWSQVTGAGDVRAIGVETVVGGSGNDSLTGSTGNDRLDGAAGNDTLGGGNGHDTLIGGTGGDSLAGGYGDDSLAGGDGDDTLSGDYGNDTATGGDGNDLFLASYGADLFDGDDGTDTVSFKDVYSALNFTLASEVSISFGSGNSLLLRDTENVVGSYYADTITGSEGANRLDGYNGSDVLEGAGGNDTLIGGLGNDTLDGGDGIDTASYEDADVGVTVNLALATAQNTGRGSDTLTDIENLTGSAYNDSLTGDSADNVLTGGLGNDTLTGGGGLDTASYRDAAARVVVDLAIGGSQNTRGAGFDTLVDIANLQGSAHADHLRGDDAANALRGEAGDDVLRGRGGDDTLIGGSGTDIADYSDLTSDLVLSLAILTPQSAGAAGFDTWLGIEGLSGGTGDDRLTGDANANRLIGNDGKDTLVGGGGDDTLSGGDGNDSLDGGSGSDTADYSGAAVKLTVNLKLSGAQNTGAGLDTLKSIENVAGGDKADTLLGSDAANVLKGGDGNDTIRGAGGGDTLLGGDGDDLLDAGSGTGERMIGGAGSDRYLLGTGTGKGTIEDSLGEHDVIDASLSKSAASIDLTSGKSSTAGGQSIVTTVGGSSTLPIDLLFLQDLSGSFGEDIANVRALAPQIVSTVDKINPGSAFGAVGFVDKPIGGFGSGSDYVYKLFSPISEDGSSIAKAYSEMQILSGSDTPEAQIEALLQVAKRADGEVGFRSDTMRVVVLFTDAEYHKAGDGASAGINTPNDGDGVLEGTPPGTAEDYPSVVQLRKALLASGIFPIFAVTSDVVGSYKGLVSELGLGGVVTLGSDSENVVAAITDATRIATRTLIEDAIGSAYGDTLRGSSVTNDLDGRAGNDKLYGLGGNDVLRGGLGNDTLDGSSGSDAADYSDATGSVTVDLAKTGAQNTGRGLDTLVSIERVIGSSRADTLKGNGSSNGLDGGGGNDKLYGFGGNDTLEGGSGNDLMDGGTGIDTALFDSASGAVTVDLALTGTQATGAGSDKLISIENVTGGASADTLLGSSAANVLNGLAGNDKLQGRGGNDLLIGGEDKDRLVGGAGDDTLDGGDGNDTLVAGSGSDSVIGGGGIDRLDFSESTSGVQIYAGSSGSVTLPGSAYTKWTGIEILQGSAHADTFYGSYNADSLAGGAGNDWIQGASGADVLWGGTGSDKFVYQTRYDSGTSEATRDLVKDFEFGKDRIDLSAIDAKSGGGANDAFKLVGSFSGAEGQLTVGTDDGLAIVQGDINGDGTADFTIAVDTTTSGTFKTADFVL